MPKPLADAPPSPAVSGAAGGTVGMVVNHRSHRNRSLPPSESAGPQVIVVRPETREHLMDSLVDFACRGVKTVVIDGGDGTVRDVLGCLPEAFGPDRHPALAIMASGKTNVIVRDTGSIPRGAAGLERLRRGLDGAAPLRETLRPALEVRRLGTDERPMRGMLFGAGAFTHGTRLANEALHPRGVHHGPAVLLAIVGVLRQTLFGPLRRQLSAGEPMTVRVEGHEPVGGRHFLVLATPLRRLMGSLWPFADVGEGPLNWLDIMAPPRGLIRMVATATLRGRATRRLGALGHGSGRAQGLIITTAAPFILDGEIFEPGPDGIGLTATAPIRFLSV